jgi:hypothetical protein
MFNNVVEPKQVHIEHSWFLCLFVNECLKASLHFSLDAGHTAGTV